MKTSIILWRNHVFVEWRAIIPMYQFPTVLSASCWIHFVVWKGLPFDGTIMYITGCRLIWLTHWLPTVFSVCRPTVHLPVVLNRVPPYEIISHLMAESCILPVGGQFGWRTGFQLGFPSVVKLSRVFGSDMAILWWWCNHVYLLIGGLWCWNTHPLVMTQSCIFSNWGSLLPMQQTYHCAFW